jgi:AcrR family transcriptional regulator
VPTIPTTPKGKRTRAQILAAARTVFDRDGFVNARMLDVAAVAGLSLGAVYRYFANKEDVFQALLAGIHEELYAASRTSHATFANDPFGALLEANFGYLSHYRENCDVMRTLVEAANVDSKFRDFWWAMRERHVTRFLSVLGEVDADSPLGGIDPGIAAQAMACMVEQAAYVWYGQGERSGAEVSLAIAAEIVTRAWYRLFFCSEPAGERSPAEARAFLERIAAENPPSRPAAATAH